MNAVTFRQKAASVLLDNFGIRKRDNQRSGRWLGRNLALIAANNDRIFSVGEKRRYSSYVILLLMDCSGSMSVHNRNRCERTARALHKIHRELTTVGAKVIVKGFNSVTRLIDFDDKLFSKDKEDRFVEVCEDYCWNTDRHGSTKPSDHPGRGAFGNHDYKAVIRGRKLLLDQKEPGKLMMVFSDGMPHCDYEPSCNEDCVTDEESARRLPQEVRVTRDEGIQVLALGIQTDAIRRFYGDNQSASCQSVDEVYGKAAFLLTKNLRRA